MPQLRYLNPEDDEYWDSSPSPGPSLSATLDDDVDDVTLNPAVEETISRSRSPDGTITAPTSSPISPLEGVVPRRAISANSTPNDFAQPYDQSWNASGPGATSLQRLPSQASYDNIPSRSQPPPAKRLKTEVIDLDSEPEISQTVQDEDSWPPSPSPNSKLLNSFTSKIPKVTKDAWSDDSSDEVEVEQEEDDVELYDKSRASYLDNAFPDFVNEIDQNPLSVDPPRHAGNVQLRHMSKIAQETSEDTAQPRKKRPYYSTVRYRFPKVPRRDLEAYVFLASCVKYASEKFRTDAEAVAKECGISPNTVGNKLRKIKKRLNEEGPGFGHPDLSYDPYAYHGKPQLDAT